MASTDPTPETRPPDPHSQPAVSAPVEGPGPPETPIEIGEGESNPPLRQLDRRVRLLWRASLLWNTLLVTGAVVLLARVVDVPGPDIAPAAGVVALGLVTLLALPPARYRTWGFAIRDSDLYVERGVLWRSTTVVPHVRIQHVDTTRGPLERWLGLATVVVYTAGVHGAAVAIPGLEAEEADRLRERLASLGGGGDAV